MKKTLKQAWIAWLWMPVLFSCATYNTKLAGYYNSVAQTDYYRAKSLLEQNGFLQQDRNRLLYLMEKGKIYHLLGSYDSSNLYLNLADNFIEQKRKTTGDVIVSNLLNPMMQTYLGEDYERFLLHYYKALNYLYKGQTDEALVEARRISLSTQAQQDKFKPNADRYTEDAFVLMVQGMIYEAAGETNNAFISYRNATDLFLSAKGPNYYGVKMPEQLKNDLFRTADRMGFTDEIDLYQRKLNRTYTKSESAEGGELILFIERGMAPEKTEQNFVLMQNGNGNGVFLFNSQYGSFNVPFDFTAARMSPSSSSLNEFRTVRVAVPSYVPKPYSNAPAVVTLNGTAYKSELAEDINTLAPEILKERILKEVTSALTRQLVKKLTEAGAAAAAKELVKNNSKEKDENKKKRNADAAALTAGLLVNIFNTATEKADTRNWQSLPAQIQYVRIPLQKGANQLNLLLGRNNKTITINGKGGIQFYNWVVAN
jgi:hypothetical protein